MSDVTVLLDFSDDASASAFANKIAPVEINRFQTSWTYGPTKAALKSPAVLIYATAVGKRVHVTGSTQAMRKVQPKLVASGATIRDEKGYVQRVKGKYPVPKGQGPMPRWIRKGVRVDTWSGHIEGKPSWESGVVTGIKDGIVSVDNDDGSGCEVFAWVDIREEGTEPDFEQTYLPPEKVGTGYALMVRDPGNDPKEISRKDKGPLEWIGKVKSPVIEWKKGLLKTLRAQDRPRTFHALTLLTARIGGDTAHGTNAERAIWELTKEGKVEHTSTEETPIFWRLATSKPKAAQAGAPPVGPTVAAMVVRKPGKILVLQRAASSRWMPGRWNLPMGHVEAGETPEQAAIRETFEEAGLRVTKTRHIGTVQHGRRQVAYFEATKYSGRVGLNEESADWVWTRDPRSYNLVPGLELLFGERKDNPTWGSFIRGEYWIDPYGETYFADIDVGEAGHDSIAVDMMLDKNIFVDGLEKQGVITKAQADEYLDDEEAGSYLIYLDHRDHITDKVGAEASGGKARWADLKNDPTYAYAKHERGIRVIGANFFAWKVTSNVLKRIVGFISEQLYDDEAELLAHKDKEVWIEESSTGRSAGPSLSELLAMRNPRDLWAMSNPAKPNPAGDEADLRYLLSDKSQVAAIGPEKGKRAKNGIARYRSPHGSTRYVMYHCDEPISALQVVSRDGKTAVIANVYTSPTHRSRRAAWKLLMRARKDFDQVAHSTHQTAAGAGWAAKVNPVERGRNQALQHRADALWDKCMTMDKGRQRDKLLIQASRIQTGVDDERFDPVVFDFNTMKHRDFGKDDDTRHVKWRCVGCGKVFKTRKHQCQGWAVKTNPAGEEFEEDGWYWIVKGKDIELDHSGHLDWVIENVDHIGTEDPGLAIEQFLHEGAIRVAGYRNFQIWAWHDDILQDIQDHIGRVWTKTMLKSPRRVLVQAIGGANYVHASVQDVLTADSWRDLL